MKDHLIYVVKLANDKFKFGITRNLKLRLNNLITTGYGTPIVIGESEFCTKKNALELEQLLKDSIGTGEYCTHAQVSRVIKTIRTSYSFQVHTDINIAIENPIEYKLDDEIRVNITPAVISEATNVCTSSTSQCVIAVGLLRKGHRRPDVQCNKTKFTVAGKRYTCENSDKATDALLQFDADKKKLVPQVVSLRITRIEEVRSRSYHQPKTTKRKAGSAAKPRRTKGRDKGRVKYFINK